MSNNNIFHGLITALITPFKQEVIDFDSLQKLIDIQIAAQVNGIVVGGSTGEGNSLSDEEYNSLVKFACLYAAGKVPIIASISTISTKSAIQKIKDIQQFGAGGLMCTVPHYIKPTQAGVIEHFRHLSANTNLPIMVYIHPGRTGIELKDETIIQLSKIERIVAIKDAGGDIERPLRLSTTISGNFNMLTGDDSNSVAYSAHAGKGCVSVISNLFPKQCKELQALLAAGDFAGALKLQQAFLPLYKAIFAEPNPIGVKYAASILGLCGGEIRLPLTNALQDTGKAIEDVIGSNVGGLRTLLYGDTQAASQERGNP